MEWEWEKAAEAGSRTMYYWGDDLDDAYGWWGKNSGDKTHPVGEKKPNSYGLYDMAGNVLEWTASDFDSKHKVLRGGSWLVEQLVAEITQSVPVGRAHQLAALEPDAGCWRHADADIDRLAVNFLQRPVVLLAQEAQEEVDHERLKPVGLA